MKDKILNNKELLEAWDWESGKPAGVSITRGESYRTGTPHEGVHLWIARKSGDDVELLFQHRAKNKALYPDCLDITVGGHVTFGQDDAQMGKIRKEAMEEIGLDIDESLLFDIGYSRFEERTDFYHHREFQHVYLLADPRPLDSYKFNDGEVIGIYAVPSRFLESLMTGDSSLFVEGFDGEKIIRKNLSRKDFHPMIFDKRMKLYMSIVIQGVRDLVMTGKIKVLMPQI
jgi:isopentenyldiphosphate isomerase